MKLTAKFWEFNIIAVKKRHGAKLFWPAYLPNSIKIGVEISETLLSQANAEEPLPEMRSPPPCGGIVTLSMPNIDVPSSVARKLSPVSVVLNILNDLPRLSEVNINYKGPNNKATG